MSVYLKRPDIILCLVCVKWPVREFTDVFLIERQITHFEASILAKLIKTMLR